MRMPGPVNLWQNEPRDADRLSAYSCLTRCLGGLVILTGLVLGGWTAYMYLKDA